MVYIAGYNSKVYAFTLGKNEPRWIYPRQGDIGGPIIGGTVVNGGKLYFGSSNRMVYALDAADGYKEWEAETGGKIWSTPAVSGNTLYVGSFDNYLYALSTSDGSEIWKFATEGAITGACGDTGG